MATYTLSVNGQRRTIDSDPEMPLLWALRDLLHLTGTKFGCGMALCGSCTVHLDGVATRACVTPISSVGEKAITTIEGLSPDGRHPVQQAWLSEQVPQCGYCQAGMIMSAAALLAAKPQATDADIDEVLGQHICRCGTYQRIRRAVHHAAGAKS